jgi:ATP-dependent DNA helicase DinG
VVAPTKPASLKEVSLHQFFGPGGVLSRTHPAYEFRRGQLLMAQAVEQALQEKRHLIVEAGTGTGKTLAYLVPALRSRKRVIISNNSSSKISLSWSGRCIRAARVSSRSAT